MKSKQITIVIFLLFGELFLTATCSFQLSLLKELNSNNKENIIFSPYSLLKSLSLLSSGAKGITRTQILSAMEVDSFEKIKSLTDSLDTLFPKENIVIANGIFPSSTPKEEFIKNGKEHESIIQKLDSTDTINQWCSKETNNKVTNIINEIKEGSKMYLINGFYFHMNWLKQFKKEETIIKKFRNIDGTISKIEMMTVSDRFQYYDNRQAEIIEFPYSGSDIVAYIFLPTRSMGINDYIKQLTQEKIKNLLDRLSMTRVELSLPKFNLEHVENLKSSLMGTGINSAFISGLGDFSNISSDNHYIEEFIHKINFSVNEEATGEVTQEERKKSREVQGNIVMNVGRPFLLMIKHLDAEECILIAKIGKL